MIVEVPLEFVELSAHPASPGVGMVKQYVLGGNVYQKTSAGVVTKLTNEGVSGGAVGEAVLDFTTNTDYAEVTITGQASIATSSQIQAFFMGNSSTAENTANDHEQAAVFIKLVCTNVIAGTGFTIKAYCLFGTCTGTFKVQWKWN